MEIRIYLTPSQQATHEVSSAHEESIVLTSRLSTLNGEGSPPLSSDDKVPIAG
jgi:hypothetical protein